MSASVTLTSSGPGGELETGGEEGGDTASLLQLNAGAELEPASCIPNVVEAPGASLPFHARLTAVTVWPDVLTVAFHALTTRWPSASVHVTDQVVAGVVAVLVTVTTTTAPLVGPLPQCESVRAVARHPPATVSAEALPGTTEIMARAVSAPTPATSQDAARATRLDNATSTPPLQSIPAYACPSRYTRGWAHGASTMTECSAVAPRPDRSGPTTSKRRPEASSVRRGILGTAGPQVQAAVGRR
ncbi:hypothetical protein MILUP08_42791 [Micromonospora lupini str. Lupac 08]|uniref:Uncharacterized protein n=1 Tax=Micromonospora lupini str. Lupac 08 TaxID=1150864 RepID=I0L213_9ACTN|nr:hypothetical protein MILUP08_42791 [Micromonospora lupini str. Lupac 08]